MKELPPTLHPSILRQDLVTRAETLQQRVATLDRTQAAGSQKLQEQLEEFASLLIFQMLQAMRRTVPHNGLLTKGFAHDLYMSLFDQEIARHIARRGDLGLTALLQRQFSEPADHTGVPGRPPSAERRSRDTLEAHVSILPEAVRKHQALAAYRYQGTQSPGTFSVPVAGSFTSPFGWRRDPFDGEERWHNGVDIAAPAGTVVQAAAPGRVLFSGTQPDYGNLLILAHADGYHTYYAHNAENLVAAGAYVEQGQPIARVGRSGRATGTHVHFEVHRHGQALDPVSFLPTLLTTAKTD
jgi:murein DD-endopeptidase MepM/ murein hydrolase activator NlpD